MPKSKTPKRTKKGKVVKKLNKSLLLPAIWDSALFESLTLPKWNIEPMTSKQRKVWEVRMKKVEAERKRRELAEKRRRAKKITMTVGEFEDKISEAEDRYRYDY